MKIRQRNNNKHCSPNDMWLRCKKLHLSGCKDWPIFFQAWDHKKKGIEPTGYSSKKTMKSIKTSSGRLHAETGLAVVSGYKHGIFDSHVGRKWYGLKNIWSS